MGVSEVEQRTRTALFHDVLTTAKRSILDLMRHNDNITRLLFYNTPDALDASNPVTPDIQRRVYLQSSPEKRVFLSAFNGETVKQTQTEVHIGFRDVKSVQAGNMKHPTLTVDVIAASAINALAGGLRLRHDALFQEINDTIEGFPVGLVGYLTLVKARETVLPGHSHVIWTAVYDAGEVRP